MTALSAGEVAVWRLSLTVTAPGSRARQTVNPLNMATRFKLHGIIKQGRWSVFVKYGWRRQFVAGLTSSLKRTPSPLAVPTL